MKRLFLRYFFPFPEEDSSNFITRVGDSGGGQFVINMQKAFEALVWACIENIIVERFGSKAARIFRYD